MCTSEDCLQLALTFIVPHTKLWEGRGLGSWGRMLHRPCGTAGKAARKVVKVNLL